MTLKNEGTQPVSLAGWTLRDRSGFEWTLSGTIGPGAVRTFVRNGQRMSLNNNGDDIVLLDDENVERDRLTYTSAAEGEIIRRTP